MTESQTRYKRILLKLSGESLAGDQSFGISPKELQGLATELQSVLAHGVEVALVIGGGNFFRGKALSEAGLGRVSSDHMGMLATLMNAIAMRDVLEQNGISARVMSAIPMSGIVDHYDRRKAMYHLSQKRVVILAGGTGNPLVTTDSAASLRAIEVEADVLLKATNVDGVYSADPAKDPMAVRYEQISFNKALEKELGVMDLAAFCQCRDHSMPIRVFNVKIPGILERIIQGQPEGTLVD